MRLFFCIWLEESGVDLVSLDLDHMTQKLSRIKK